MSRRLTIQQYAQRRNQNERTIRNYIGRGYFPVYRVADSKGVLIDVDEADAALAKIPSARARSSYGNFGPKARVIDLSHRVTAVEHSTHQCERCGIESIESLCRDCAEVVEHDGAGE